jgi:hypothetical protein
MLGDISVGESKGREVEVGTEDNVFGKCEGRRSRPVRWCILAHGTSATHIDDGGQVDLRRIQLVGLQKGLGADKWGGSRERDEKGRTPEGW